MLRPSRIYSCNYLKYDTFAGDVYTLDTAGITLTAGTLTAADLRIDTDLIYTDSTNDRVGIGRVPTTHSLEVAGNIQAVSGSILADGVFAPSIFASTKFAFSVAWNDWIQSSEEGKIQIYIDNLSRFEIDVDEATFTVPIATSGTITGTAITGTSLNTGQGAYELYAMNQDVETSDLVTFTGLTVDSPTLFVDSVNHRVGILTLSPQREFHLASDKSGATIALVENSSTGSAAEANFATGQTASVGSWMRFGTLGTGYTTVGGFVQDGGYVSAEAGLSGGMSIITKHTSGVIRFYTGGFADANKRMEIDENGNVAIATSLRGSTSLWWRVQHVDISSIPATGAVGAVYIPQSANNLNGYQLDNAPSEEYLYFNTHIGTDWDEASDLEFVVQFETNVDNSGGNEADTVDFDLVMYYKGDGETTQKTQDLDASVVVGQAGQYYHEQVAFTIDYDKVDHVVQIGDCVSWQLHLNTTDSEVDNVIVHHGMFRYKTNKVRAEV